MLDLLSIDLRSRRVLAWANQCERSPDHYGCGAAPGTPCLHDGLPWHPYRVSPSGEQLFVYNKFPFHSARWNAVRRMNLLEIMAVLAQANGGFDPNDLTVEEGRRYTDSMTVRQH